MVQFIPLIDWLATLCSVALLIVLWDEIGSLQRALISGSVVSVAGIQFFTDSFTTAKIAFALQTVLAVYLIIRWRMSG